MNKLSDHHHNDIYRLWPAQDLLKAIGFGRRVAGRVEEYLASHGLLFLSLHQLMDLFLPFSHAAPPERWNTPPIRQQPQFGRYLFTYALATLSSADLGAEFKAEWDIRLQYYHYTKIELMAFATRADRDKGASSLGLPGTPAIRPHNAKPPERSVFYTDEIGVSNFREVSIHFPGDVYLLASWVIASDAAKSTNTMKSGTTLRGFAGKFVSMYGSNRERPLSIEDVLGIFAAHGITGNPVIRP